MGTANAQTWCYINYIIDTIPYNPAPYGVGTPIVSHGYPDTFSSVIPIGFTFNFYSNNYSNLVIGPNCLISFGAPNANQPTGAYMSNPNPPSTYDPLNTIFLSAMRINSSKLKYTMTGTAPYRKFIISYDTVAAYNSSFDSTLFKGQIILFETTNIIELHIFHHPVAMFESFIGLQNSNATLGWSYDNYWTKDTLGMRFTPYNAPDPALSICIVTVDSATGKNMIVWNQPTGIPVDSFIIYKETSQANVYTPIGAQMYNVFSTFIDTGSYPAIVSNTYRLGFRDSCGIISDTSAPHTTIHLVVSQGSGNSWNLSWNAYVGFTFPSYNIYRGTSPSTMTLWTTVNSNVFAYTDLTPPSTVFYAIEVVDSAGCNPSARMANNYSTTMSNIASPNSTGINEIKAFKNISIYPNPANSIINFNTTSSIINHQLSIEDVLGNKIYQQTIIGINTIIDISTWSEGIYFYEIRGQEGSTRGKFVVQK
jgi:hypothetical protein